MATSSIKVTNHYRETVFVTMEQSRSNTNTSTSVTVTKLRHKVSHRMIRGVIIKLYVIIVITHSTTGSDK